MLSDIGFAFEKKIDLFSTFSWRQGLLLGIVIYVVKAIRQLYQFDILKLAVDEFLITWYSV